MLGEVLEALDSKLSHANDAPSSQTNTTTTFIHKWLDTLPLSLALATALSSGLTQAESLSETNSHNHNAETTLEALTSLTDTQMEAALDQGCNALKAAVHKGTQQLRACLQKQKEQKQSDTYKKYCENLREMACGSVQDFHGGLVGRVGMPDLHFLEAMRDEHCSKYGHDKSFTSSNYGITTTPRHEWHLIMSPDEPGHQHDMQNGRTIPNIDDLVSSEVAVKAQLTRHEVVAVVLYTGPMYTRYNTMLRRYPAADHADFSSHNNTFATTIFVLVSAVQKIARCTPVPAGTMLYRGLGGNNMLPDRFTSGDEQHHNVKGYTEWGFMSTTASRHIAVQYSGAKQGRPQAFVMEIAPNAVDRGACIRDLSQYPCEEEYLWVPCSFIQPVRDAVLEIVPEGLITVLPVHVNANIKADTVEELVQRKHHMHVTAFSTVVESLKPSLMRMATDANADDRLKEDSTFIGYNESFTVDSLVQSIVDECKARLERHHSTDAQALVNDAVFREMVQEMLDVQLWAQHKLMVWLNDDTLTIHRLQGYSLQRCHRQWVVYVRQQMRAAASSKQEQARAQWAVKYLQAKGRIKQRPDEISVSDEARVIEAAGDGWTALDMQALVMAGADVNSTDKDGVCGVYMAAANGHVQCVRELVAAGAHVNKADKDGVTAVYMAAENGHVECVQELVSAGADVNKVEKEGFSPLFRAARNGHVECVRALVSAGADVNKTRSNGASPVLSAAFNGHVECVRELVSAGADVNKTRNDGFSPVLMAAQNGHVECVRALVSAGADVNKTNNDGVSPVYMAAQEGHVECVRELVSAGADHTLQCSGLSALDVAQDQGHQACMDYLSSL